MARPGPQQPPEVAIGVLDPPEAMAAADLFDMLPPAARRDIAAGLGEGF